MTNEEQRKRRAKAVRLLLEAVEIYREIGDPPEEMIQSAVECWLMDEPDDRIDEHFYEKLAKTRAVPLGEDEEIEDEDEEGEVK